MRKKAGLLTVLTLLLGCAPPMDPQLPAEAAPVDDQTLLLDQQYSAVTSRQRLVIRDSEAWERLWADAHRNMLPVPAVPEIDFSANVVIAAAMGTRSSGGYSVGVEVLADQRGVRAVVTERSPGPRCIVTAALTAPVVAVRVPGAPASVSFVERTETSSC